MFLSRLNFIIFSILIFSINAHSYDEVPGDNQPSSSSSDSGLSFGDDIPSVDTGSYGNGTSLTYGDSVPSPGGTFDNTSSEGLSYGDGGSLGPSGADNSHGSGFPGPSGEGSDNTPSNGSGNGKNSSLEEPSKEEVDSNKQTTIEKLYSTVSAIAQKTLLGKAVKAVSHVGKEIQKVAKEVLESVTPRTKTDLEALTAMAKGMSEFRDKVPKADHLDEDLYEEIVRNYGMSKAREVYESYGHKPAGQQYPTGPMDAMAKMKGFEFDSSYYDPRVNESLYSGGTTRAEEISENMGDMIDQIDDIAGQSATTAATTKEITSDTVTIGYAGSHSHIESVAKTIGPEATFGFENSVTITGSPEVIDEIAGILGQDIEDGALGANINGSIVDEVLSGGVVVVSDDLTTDSAITTVAEELHHAAQAAVSNQTHQKILDHKRGLIELSQEELDNLNEVNAASASFGDRDYTRDLPQEDYDRINEIARTPTKTNPNGLPSRDENWNYVMSGTEIYAKAKVGVDYLSEEIQKNTGLEPNQADEIAEIITESHAFNVNSQIMTEYIQGQ